MKRPLTVLVALIGLLALDPYAGMHVRHELFAAPTPVITFTVVNDGIIAWRINGVDNPPLTLNRGSKYVFDVTALGHSFYIKTLRETGAVDQFTDGVKNNGTASGMVTFDVPATAPDRLFYQCGVHIQMGGNLNIAAPVGVGDAVPSVAWLGRAIPNPTQRGASFRFGLPRDASIDVTLFDARGRKVRSLWNGTMTAGVHSIQWDGRDESRRTAASGAYFYRLRVEGRTLTGRLFVTR